MTVDLFVIIHNSITIDLESIVTGVIMPILKFANIIYERNPRSMSYPSLYCSSTGPVIAGSKSNEIILNNKGSYDFTTYFNALSVKKLKQYTSAKRFYLHLEIKGDSSRLVQTSGDAFSSSPEELPETTINFSQNKEWTSLDLELQVPQNAVLIGFRIDTSGEVRLSNCYYSIEIDHEPRNVNLLLSTTTFKKEDFIRNNVKIIKKEIIDSDEDISNHFSMHISDNAGTLDRTEIETSNIAITKNNNVGGAGGFACGMIKALESKKPYTHILLMDDDVAISPESIKRTFNLLRILNSTYKNAFISGAMLNYEAGDEQWEDIGYMTPEGAFAPVKPQLHLSRFEDVILNETFKLPKQIRDLKQTYAAWWYCCIPLKTVQQQKLPLPVFVRCDDAEYGVRCQPEIITMNSLCIWHMSFHARYNAAVERYQTTRNTLIAQHTTGFALNSDFFKELNRNIHLELKKFGYENAKLCLDAFEDFMKGPDFIATPGIAEKTFMAANKNKEQLISFEEIETQMHKLGFEDFSIDEITRQLIDSDIKRSIIQRTHDYLTDNNQKLITNNGSGYAIIPAAGWTYPAGIIRGKQYLIVIDWYNRQGAIRKKNPKEYKKILKRYKKDLKKYKQIKNDLLDSYKKNQSKLTSIEFWKEYLSSDKVE